MKLDPAAYHDICNLTMNVAVSRAEAETWKKCLLTTADEKIKVQRNQLTVNLLRKLRKVGVGVNSVEVFARKNPTALDSTHPLRGVSSTKRSTRC